MKNRIGKSLVVAKQQQRSRATRLRRLQMEALEGRRLLSADTSVLSNTLISEDVNGDFRVSALDALLVINNLNNRQTAASGEMASSGSGTTNPLFLDVNGDGRVSAMDALRIVNRLNAEGQDPEILMTYTYSITNVVSQNNPAAGSPLSQVFVGQQFQVNVFVQDSRDLSTLPVNEDGQVIAGVFSAGMDLGVSSLDLAQFQFSTNFRSGILFSSNYPNGRQGFEGANFQDEYFNEVTAVSAVLGPQDNPDQPKPFYSVRFVATNPGTLTFNPNGPESLDAENLLVGNPLVIPNTNINFGNQFSITILADPNIPVANPDQFSMRQGTSLTIQNSQLLANDTGVDLPLTVTGIQAVGGTQGTLVGNVFTPAPGFVGIDTLAYTIQDTQGRTAQGSISINVLPQIVANDDAFTVQVDSSGNSLDVLSNDLPVGVVVSQVFPATQGGSVSIAPGGGSLIYTPQAGFVGVETFTYRISDNAGDGAFDTATVTVNVIERLPAAGSFTVAVDEATQDNIVNVLANVQVNEGEVPVLVGLGMQPANGTAVIDDNGTPDDPTDDFVRYTPNPGFVGTDTFTYIANDTSDPQEPDSTGTVTVIVREVNFPPILANDSVDTLERQGAVIPISNLLANDRAFLDGQTLSLTSVRAISPMGGSVRVEGSNVIYTADPNYFFGTFLFEYTATDDFVRPLSSTATVTVNVAPVNDPPIIPGGIAFRGFKNIPLNIPVADALKDVLPGPPNELDQTLSVIAVGPNATSNGSVVGSVVLNQQAGLIVFTPMEDFVGAATFSFTVRDSGGTANGGVDTSVGQINVNVEEFQPSTIGGSVWVDDNRNGQMDSRERHLGGVVVTLTGTTLGQAIAPQSVLTLADGSYSFNDLGPGSYQIAFQPPAFMMPSSSFSTMQTVEIAQPGGATVNRNFAVLGLSAQYASWLGQLVSGYFYTDPSMAVRGALFAVGYDNSMLWGMKLDGFEDAKFTEAVFDGNTLLFTMVDSQHRVYTARLNSSQYAFTRDSAGNTLVRILGSMGDFDWSPVDRQHPTSSAPKYLSSVDAVFSQQGWDYPV
jgi:hypothetical protein